MHTDIVNTEHSEHWLGMDDSDNTDKLAVMAAIVKKSPVFRLQKSGNPMLLLYLRLMIDPRELFFKESFWF